MSTPTDPSNSPTIESKEDLINYFASGEKTVDQYRIGTEHEKFAFDLSNLRRIPYEGEKGIRNFLLAFEKYGWEPYRENGNPIAMRCPKTGATISLEPGGQVELSGAPVSSVHDTCQEVREHLDLVKTITGQMGIGMLGMGTDPKWEFADVPWMPKGRYKIMGEYMPKKGTLGLDMMTRTCTVQVNLDYSSEQDMINKMRIGVALQPLATALFANSPLLGGKDTGYLSYRSHIWTDTDPDRSGMIGFVFDQDFGYERWIEYMMDVPMYFLHDIDGLHDVSGLSFRKFMDGELEGFKGRKPTIKNWEDHLSTVFPEVRLKKFIEMRGADGGSWDILCALPAFWVGLIYDEQSINDCLNIIANWESDDICALRDAVPKTALKTEFQNRPLNAWAVDILNISKAGLERRQRLNNRGSSEAIFLDKLMEIAVTGKTQAENLLEKYNNRMASDVDRIFYEMSF